MISSRICVSCHSLRSNNTHRLIVGKYFVSGPSPATTKKTTTKESTSSAKDTIGDEIIPKSEIDPVSGLPFRKLELIALKKKEDGFKEELARPFDRVTHEPRANRMATDQDWPSVWPTAHSFKASAVPLPVRMGYQQSLKTPPPTKTGNVELMKIPNFFHLTPPAIKRHCDAIKKFCTPWPKELSTAEEGGDRRLLRQHYPIELQTCDYVHSGPSIRDARSRIVTLRVKFGDLPLGDVDSRPRQKFIKLVGDRYDKATDMLTIVTDRCPVRHQNRDYAMYLLAVLFHESWKEDSWETEITVQDQHKWYWRGSKCEDIVYDIVKRMKSAYESCKPKDQSTAAEAMQTAKNAMASYPEYIRHAKKEMTKDELVKLLPIKSFADDWQRFRNNAESVENIAAYGNSVRTLLGLPQSPKS